MKLRILSEKNFEEITWDDDSISKETAYKTITERSRLACEGISQILVDLFGPYKKTREFFIYPLGQVQVDWKVENIKNHPIEDPADDWEDTFGNPNLDIRLKCEMVEDDPFLPAITIRAFAHTGHMVSRTAIDLQRDLPDLKETREVLQRIKDEIY